MSANPIQQFMNKQTRQRAIKAKCAECVGCTPTHVEAGFKQTIHECTAKACPLFKFRPYQALKTSQVSSEVGN